MPPVSATRSIGSHRVDGPCAAATVFLSSMAIVSGPTPPGTGVSAPATSATAGMHVADDDGPASGEVAPAVAILARTVCSTMAASVTALMPDVDDRRARLHEVRRDEPRAPDRRDENVGRRARLPASRVSCEWQIVTVASRCSSSIAIGFPTMSLRPMTTACVPAIGIAAPLEHLDHAGRRARHQVRAPLHEPADVDGVKAVDVLRRIDRVEDLLRRVLAHRVAAAATARGCRRGRRSRSAARRAPAARSSDAVAGSRCRSARRPVSVPAFTLLRT